MIYVFMIDDHPMFIDGVKSAFNPEIDKVEFVGSANLCTNAIEPLKESGSDVVLLDLNMPEWRQCNRLKILRKGRAFTNHAQGNYRRENNW